MKLTEQDTRVFVDSLGVYLPDGRLANRDLAALLPAGLQVPIERLTGIKSRTQAQGRYSFDLAVSAAERCLAASELAAADIQAVFYCGISRFDGPGYQLTLAPSGAMRLSQKLGLQPQWALDLNNACAGVMTGLYYAQALLASRQLTTALVVSGEYISHLLQRAAPALRSLRDQRLACLTLGDAGGAVLLRAGTTSGLGGFAPIKMASYGRFSNFCTAAPQIAEPGYMMYTDAAEITEAGVRYGAAHSAKYLKAYLPANHHLQHFIGHQVSAPLLKRLLAAINQGYGERVLDHTMLRACVQDTGNTASTSQLVAWQQAHQAGVICAGDDLLLTAQASGLTVGSALYRYPRTPPQFLPVGSAYPGPAAKNRSTVTPGESGQRLASGAQPVTIPVAAVTYVPQRAAAGLDTISQAALAAGRLFTKLRGRLPEARATIELLVFAGMYKSGFVDEPAQAAILAGRLGIGGNAVPTTTDTTDAFAADMSGGDVAALQAATLVHLRLGLWGAAASNGLVLTSDDPPPTVAYGCEAGALLLGGLGFLSLQAPWFYQYPEYRDLQQETLIADGSQRVESFVHKDFWRQTSDCIAAAVARYLAATSQNMAAFKCLYAPSLPYATRQTLAGQLGIVLACEADLGAVAPSCSSGLARSLAAAEQEMAPGEKALLVLAAPGIQVAVATILRGAGG